MEKIQFRVLYREFIFRMVDLELLSADALGDSNKLLGRFAALLIFLSIGLAIPSLGVGNSRMSPPARLVYAWSAEHFLIATTMLVVGLFAVLSWDSTFPDRRDVLVLAPLPVRARTLFLAKVAAVGTAMSLTVALLHGLAGLVWPLALGTQETVHADMPALTYLPATAPVDVAGLEHLLNRDLAPVIPRDMGIAIGVVKRGERRIFAYGTARPDSIYQIASISKTFTGLLLAQMVEQGKVKLEEPVRELLPAGTVRKPAGREITLLDLATHRSGLPPMPDNIWHEGMANPGADYHAADLYAFIGKQGVARQANPPFIYSNLGFSVLGQALADRAGTTYAELLAQHITGPLGMRDTALLLSPEQQARMIQAYGVRHELRPPWELDALAPAGGLRSTAADILTDLEAQLRADSAAIRLSHELRSDVAPGMRIALAWFYDEDTGTYWHNGAISAYTSHALFNPKEGYAVVVLANQATPLVTFADLAAKHIQQRLTGQPAISLASVTVPTTSGFLSSWLSVAVARAFAAWWITMLGAGAFIFCCVLGLQGLAAQLLPRRVFLRASSFLQLAAFCGIVSVYFLQPFATTGETLMAVNSRGLLAWSPSFWFVGLFQQLSGSPALASLAPRAWIGLSIALCVTAIAYALSYFRTLRQIVEEPDIVPGARRSAWLPRFGDALRTAVVQFSMRTLLRSRQHRVILAFYLGIGFAFTILLVKTPAVRDQLADAPVSDPWGQVNSPILAATIAMMGFAVIGTRIIFSIPLDLRANWIYRVTAVRSAPECLAASRRALLVLALGPVWLVSAAVCLWMWPWRPAVGHLAILALIGAILAELCLHGFQKIPFTCSYLPGKSQVHLAVLGGMALLWYLAMSIRFERQILEDFTSTVSVVVALTVIAVGAHWRTQAEAKSEEAEVQFEDAFEPAVQSLGLNRDQ